MTNHQPTSKEIRVQQMQVSYAELSDIVQPLKAGHEPVQLFSKHIQDDDSLNHAIEATLYPQTDPPQDVYPYIKVVYTTPENEEGRLYGIRQKDLQEIARDIKTWISQEITPYL